MGPNTAVQPQRSDADTIGGTDAPQPDSDDTTGVTADAADTGAATEDPTEQDGVAEEAEAEDSFWFEGATSKYRSAEDAKRGIEEKDKYIAKLTQELEQTKAQAALADRYKSLVSADQLRDQRIRERLPEQYRGLSEDDIDNEEELRKYLRARLDAELLVEKEDRENQEQAERQAKAEAAARDAAQQFMAETVTPEFFEVTNPEDRAALAAMLDQRDEDGYSPLEKAQWIATYVSKSAARNYLVGVRSDFWAGRKQVVTKIIKDRVRTEPAKPVDPAPPTPRKQEKQDPRSMIKQGLFTTAKNR